ncbi:hypothetical protein [Desulforamulus ferrireducens]|uniref:hypothetical protein n=1 Tax=Desulforamulus ferrireducens TaxID=1833852 RepID=UPI00135650A7|nr:hypothetical protein [Desulforamulus ferrireducens]
MFCPKCKSEFTAGISKCTSCHIPLVKDLSEPASRTIERDPVHPNMPTGKF